MGDEQAAEKVLLEFAEANPDNRSVRRELVSMYEDTDRWDDVLVYRHQLVGLESDTAVAKFELAEAYLKVKQPDSALGYVAAAAADGFADYRRLTRNPSLAPLRELDGFAEIAAKVKANAEEDREERLAPLLADEEKMKAEALGRILDIKAPDFSLPNLDGETISLESLRGQIVILDFWATWCGPCRMTMPLLQQFVERKPEGVRFFSVNVWESDTSKVRPFLADYGYDFDVLFGNDALPQAYGVSGIPTLFVIDKDGIIRYRHVGYSPYADQFLKWQTDSLL
jgi:thiol-disulfide isomerase/thioredoxin